MYVDFNIDYIHLLLSEFKKWTFVYNSGQRCLYIYISSIIFKEYFSLFLKVLN